MQKFVVHGKTELRGTVEIAGAKNVALKTLVGSLLTDDTVTLENVPNIRDVVLMLEVLGHLGKKWTFEKSRVVIEKNSPHDAIVPLEIGARLRASSMVLGPLLSRYGKAQIPNPGGCRIGARPIDRHIEGLKQMGAKIRYDPKDGYFYASAEKLTGTDFRFEKNTHTGTETLILASVISKGTTILRNAAEEVEIDDLIAFLISMGASITRNEKREIRIEGVEKLHGTTYRIMPDRNEEVTFAIAAIASKGNVLVKGSQREHIQAFLKALKDAGGTYEEVGPHETRYIYEQPLHKTHIVTAPHPGFMTDWQAPWALLMTQSTGVSTIHETVFENRFSYVEELKKMGADIEFYHPHIDDPNTFYNFNWEDMSEENSQAIRITGPTPLHNAVVTINDLRAGATLLLSTIIANGVSYLYGIDQIDRGYEHIEEKLSALGAHLERREEDTVS